MEVSVRGLTLRCQRFGTQGGPRWLGFHGWMDNSASLIGLARQFPEFDWVLVDQAGHGQSDHRGSAYHYIDYVADAVALLDVLEWDSCHVLGHSMGAGVALMAAATTPERVQSVVLIEGLGPLTTEPLDAVSTLRTAALEKTPSLPNRVYSSVEEAVERRSKLVPEIPTDATRELVLRGLSEVDGGWVFSHDARLRMTSTLRLTEAHVSAFLANVDVPVCLVVAADGLRYDATIAERRMSEIRDLYVVELPGGHHVHMQYPVEVASAIYGWMETKELLPAV